MKKLLSMLLVLSLMLGLVALASAEEVLQVAAIETAYGAEMWQEVTAAFTEKTGIKVELVTDKNLEDVITASMKGGDYPDVVMLATGRKAALTETMVKENLLTDLTDVLEGKVLGEDVLVKDKIVPGFLDTSVTNPYGDGKTYLAPMFYSRYGLNLIMERLKETSEVAIHTSVLTMNLWKRLRELLFALIQRVLRRGLLSLKLLIKHLFVNPIAQLGLKTVIVQ